MSLDELYSAQVRERTCGQEFNVNEFTKCVKEGVSLNRNTHATGLCIDQLTKILCPEANRNLFSIGPMIQYSLIQCL